MKQNFVFQVTAPDVDALLPEVSSALEQWMELFSRRKYPKLWALTDRINRWNKALTARAKRQPAGAGSGAGQLDHGNGVAPSSFSRPRLACVSHCRCVVSWHRRSGTLAVFAQNTGRPEPGWPESFSLWQRWAIPMRWQSWYIWAAQYLIVALASLLVRKRQDPYDRAAQKSASGKGIR